MVVFLAMKRRIAKRDTTRVMAIAVTTQMMLCNSRQLGIDEPRRQTQDKPKALLESVRRHRLGTSSLRRPGDAQIKDCRSEKVKEEDIAREVVIFLKEKDARADEVSYPVCMQGPASVAKDNDAQLPSFFDL